ncbi:MAG: F0F1 ATP synthase subunit A [Deltaproteobacteria bacterium]|nr:F0F1 ATP synthase subunit A [Deltaproteobacteria bacterium]
MDELSKIWQWNYRIGDYNLVFNVETLIMTWIVMAVLIFFAISATRKLAYVPSPLQTIAEFIVTTFDGLVQDALELKDYRKYSPLICALFMFLLLSNWIGIIPYLSEPTKDLNTTLSMGLLGFVIAHYSGIRAKGLKRYLSEYCQPMFFMAPLNIIGEIAKVVSVSFRLYGNIMGGSIIILVVSHLLWNLVIPPFLNLFFGLFVGTIQAFVFTMLTLVYISVQIK